MRIVAIAGSPRKQGNSPVEMNIVGCYGCHTCPKRSSWPMFGYQILSTVVNGFKWIGMECRSQIIAIELGDAGDWKKRPDLVSAAERLIEV